MSKTIRNLQGNPIQIIGETYEMGRRYLDAQYSEHPFPAYVYHAPETGKTYIVEPSAIAELGRIVYAIAHRTTEYLENNEACKYAGPDGGYGLCNYGYAYSIWCSSNSSNEGTRPDVNIP